MDTLRLSDQAIARLVQLLQVGILTGTDVSDQFRTVELTVGDNNKLECTEEYNKNFEENLQKMANAGQ